MKIQKMMNPINKSDSLKNNYCFSGRIVRAKGKTCKIMWIIGVAGLGLLCSYFTSSLTNEFMEFSQGSWSGTVLIPVVYLTTLDNTCSIVCNKAFDSPKLGHQCTQK